ncbi:MAG: hypothetical protein WC069_01535 [Candidatus Shapirobacteria bacterium]
MKINNKYFLLFLTLIFGYFLLSYRLGEIPRGVVNDEAVVGYDAYSILNTGRDQYGQFLPVYFKFFGSFTPGLFVYLETIPIKLLGLNSFSIRILSVISILILGMSLFLFLEKNKIMVGKYSSILAVFLFLITPWTFFNARIGYETTFAFVLISIGVLLYTKPILAFGLISMSTYAGHTQRYLAPLFMLLIYFVFYFRKKSIKELYMPILLAALIQIPNFVLIFTPSFWVKNNSFTTSFFAQYLSYFAPVNLFFNEDYKLQRSIPEMSVFYSWMLVPWVMGFYEIIKNNKKPIYRLILGLAILSPIPAALANTDYSTQRALPLLLPYFLIIMMGIDRIIFRLKNKISIVLGFVIVLFSMLMLYRSYFIFFPSEREQVWDYGYESLSKYVLDNPDKKFVVDNGRSVPYIELLFFTKNLINNRKTNNYYFDTDFDNDAKFANIEIRPIDWRNDICIDQILVGDSLAISKGQIEEHFLTKVFEQKDKHNAILLQGYVTNPKLKCGIVTKVNR